MTDRIAALLSERDALVLRIITDGNGREDELEAISRQIDAECRDTELITR